MFLVIEKDDDKKHLREMKPGELFGVSSSDSPLSKSTIKLFVAFVAAVTVAFLKITKQTT